MQLEDRYSIGPELGKGTFGIVNLVIEKSTGKKLAMKRLMGDFSSWTDFNSFRELQSLMLVSRHPNIVQINEVHFDPSSLYFLFEYMDGGSLYDLLMSRQQHQQQGHHHQMSNTHSMPLLLHEDEIRSILQQTLQGLSHMHKQGYMHRDMKPENILVNTGGVYKVADFSLARKYYSHHHHRYDSDDGFYSTTTITSTTTASYWRDNDPLTAYVSTRWYRAPEILLCMQDYGPAVDSYAMACIAAECFMGRPLFPGKTEIDQLHYIFQLLGAPTRQSWKQGWEHLQTSPFSVTPSPPAAATTSPHPRSNSITLSSSWSPDSHVSASSARYHRNTMRLLHQDIPMASLQAIDLIVRLLRLDPNKRLTCDQALQHGFLRQSSPSFFTPQTHQRQDSSLATVREDTSPAVGEASAAVDESAQHVSPMILSETPARTVVATPSSILSPSQVAAGTGSTTASAVALTNDHHTLDIPMLPPTTPANAAITEADDDDSMKSSHSFSSRSSSSTSSSMSTSSCSSSSSSMSSDSSDDDSFSDDDSIDDENVMNTKT